jgi:hypothetical protein
MPGDSEEKQAAERDHVLLWGMGPWVAELHRRDLSEIRGMQSQSLEE